MRFSVATAASLGRSCATNRIERSELRRIVVATSPDGKLAAMRYWFAFELPRIYPDLALLATPYLPCN